MRERTNGQTVALKLVGPAVALSVLLLVFARVPLSLVGDALRRANGSVKLAVLLLNGCSVDDGLRLIEQANGRLVEALARVRR